VTQRRLGEFADSGDGPDTLTDAEREVYVAVEREGVAVRELARETERRPGTVRNLLKRARLRLADREEEEVSETW